MTLQVRRGGDGKLGARVEAIDLAKEYHHHGNDLRVLQRLNFTLEPGDRAAVVGASGVGKSTLLQLLGTLDSPTHGRIVIGGVDVSRLASAKLAEFRNHNIGFVFQFHHLLPEFTAEENVMMPCLIGGLSRAEARERAVALLERVGLAKRLTHRPGEMSGGEQQRVSIARALVMRPALVLADEPTGNLDSRTGIEIQQLFLDMNVEYGCTLLIVTHNLELAAKMPRCFHMGDGGVLVEKSVAAQVMEAHSSSAFEQSAAHSIGGSTTGSATGIEEGSLS